MSKPSVPLRHPSLVRVILGAIWVACTAASLTTCSRETKPLGEHVVGIREVAAPTSSDPVTAGLTIKPALVRAGETFEVTVQVRIAGGHWIYSMEDPSGSFAPTSVKLDLPKEIEPVGEWSAPEPQETESGRRVYTDTVTLRRTLRLRSAPATTLPISLEAVLSCQACNDELCWPPTELRLLTSVLVAP